MSSLAVVRSPSTTYNEVKFSPTLALDSHAPLRQRTREHLEVPMVPPGESLESFTPHTVLVDTLPTANALRQEVRAGRKIDLCLIFDLHRMMLFRPTGSKCLLSLLRFLREGYPIQPKKRLAKHIENHGFVFLYPLASLDILPHLWPQLIPDEITILDMVTGDVSRSAVPLHASVGDLTTGDHTGFSSFEDRYTGPSLRESTPVDLQALVSPAAIVHRCFTVRDRLSLPFTTTEVRWHQGRRRESCFGRSRRHDTSQAVALCEALERFQIAFKPSATDLVLGSYSQLEARALDPLTLFFGRSPQCPEDTLPPFDPDASLHWTEATPAGGGEAILVPAQDVWFQTSRLPGETTFISPTTNACAIGGSLEEAALFALLEAAERDAFLTTWYLRRRAQRIDPDSVDDREFQEFRHRWELAYSNYSFRLFDITTDLALPAVMAVALRNPNIDGRETKGPRVFVGNACRLSAVGACRAALQDLAGFDPDISAERLAEFRVLLEEPERISGPAEHFSLYALDEPLERLNFLDLEPENEGISASEIQTRALVDEAPRYNLRTILEQIDHHSRALGVGVYFKDLTHNVALERGLHCVKAIAPGLFPIWFGHGSRRFRPTHRLQRLAKSWGLDDRSSHPRETHFNLQLHPFS